MSDAFVIALKDNKILPFQAGMDLKKKNKILVYHENL
jgi:hypothetical protein